MANYQYLHVNAATAGAVISPNSGANLIALVINTAASAATSSIFTIYDGQSTAGTIIAICNMQNSVIPSFTYRVVAAGGLFYTYIQTGAVTAVGDFTLVYV